MKDYEYDTQVIEAAEAFVEASKQSRSSWLQYTDAYIALGRAVRERNAALVESQA
jgi:hypothetical protein